MNNFDVFYRRVFKGKNGPDGYMECEILTVYDINLNPDNGSITFLVYLHDEWQYIDSCYCTPYKESNEE